MHHMIQVKETHITVQLKGHFTQIVVWIWVNWPFHQISIINPHYLHRLSSHLILKAMGVQPASSTTNVQSPMDSLTKSIVCWPYCVWTLIHLIKKIAQWGQSIASFMLTHTSKLPHSAMKCLGKLSVWVKIHRRITATAHAVKVRCSFALAAWAKPCPFSLQVVVKMHTLINRLESCDYRKKVTTKVTKINEVTTLLLSFVLFQTWHTKC